MAQYVKINAADNVAVAVDPLPKASRIAIDNHEVVLQDDIPAGHKFALVPIARNSHVIKYGYPIGHAVCDLPEGGLVNEQNLKTNLDGVLQYHYRPDLQPVAIRPTGRTFMGYLRSNGSAGTRNEIWIIPTVGCVNGIVNAVAERFRAQAGNGVDAIVAWPHNYGCSQLGDDHNNTRLVLRDMVLHPNAGGVLVVGLGCENNQIEAFRELVGEVDTERIKFIETQKVEGDETEACIELLRQIYTVAAKDVRTPQPLSKLRVGLKCGGSDGFSGITANPLLGRFSDYLISEGGTSVLTEVPEMFGAETILMNRCCDRQTFDKTVHLINSFKEYFMRNNQPVYENPSPGNKAGGISTLEEKSLGCTQKCGSSSVQDVLQYGQRLSQSGLNLLSAPGNDLVASTALAAAGCQMVLFTTGRGTPFGTFVPTMKVSTNSPLATAKPHWIDFNAGPIVEGTSIDELCSHFIDSVIEIASGRKTNNELHGYREIAIFKTGVTL